MPYAELIEWWIYEQIEPFGERARWIQAGLMCSVIANSHRAKDSDKVWQPSDFMPQLEAPGRVAQSPDEQFQMMLTLQQLQNTKGHA